MDGRKPNSTADGADDEYGLGSLLREVFEWPKPPESLRVEIMRRLAGMDSPLDDQRGPTRRPATNASNNGMEPNTPMTYD
jgi:hypothetical protein